MYWLRAIIRGFAGMINDLFGMITRPFARMFRDVAGLMHGMIRFLDVRRLFNGFWNILPLNFVSKWFKTRDYRVLLGSIPALLAGGLLLTGIVVAAFSRKPERSDYYIIRAIQARQRGDNDVARLFLRKASLKVAGTLEARYNQAVLFQSIGNEQEAYAIMRDLAPDDKPGFIKAHEWRIQWYRRELARNMDQEVASESDLRRRLAMKYGIESQLELIVQADPDHLEANDRLSVIRFARKDLRGAIKNIERIVDRQPGTRVLYAQLLSKVGREKDARVQAERAMNYHQKVLRREGIPQQDQWMHRLRASTALMILDEYKDAAEILMVRNQSSDNEHIQRALADALFAWSETLTARNGSTLLHKLKLLDHAHRLRPGDAKVLERIATIAGAPGEPGAIASVALKELLSTGQAPPVVHFVLGMNASHRGDLQAAMMHYELAYRASPDTPVTLNNLAYVISKSEKPDLDRALKLIDLAIELEPKVPDFYDTRGEILMQKGHWRAAIADLESALRDLPERPSLHRKLATAYAAAGDMELAAMHRTRAASKEKAQEDYRKMQARITPNESQ